MKIKIFHYPKTFTFEIEQVLPPFPDDSEACSCEVRTEIFRQEVAKIDYDVQHAPDDFFVEQVIPTRTGGEIWNIGS
jgi:hypothetical protein